MVIDRIADNINDYSQVIAWILVICMTGWGLYWVVKYAMLMWVVFDLTGR